jgi:integrase
MSSTPNRLKVPQQRGKPLQVVTDPDGNPVMSGPHFLAYHVPSGRYYVGRSDPRAYLGTDLSVAVWRFRGYCSRQTGETVPVETHVVPSAAALAGQDMPSAARYSLRAGKIVETVEIPESVYWARVREDLLKRAPLVAEKTGIPEVARLAQLPKPSPSVPLSAIYDLYCSRRKKPCQDETRKVKQYWDAFVLKCGARTVSDITADAVKEWADAAYYGSPKTIRHRLEYPRRLFAYAVKMGIDKAECERVLCEIHKIELPESNGTDPRPISKEHFDALLDGANVEWKAILLTALNCCYYGVDVRTLPVSAADLSKGTVVFDRGKTRTARVAVLWDRTVKAIRAYQAAEPHNAPTLFITQYGSPYSEDGLRSSFRYLRRDLKLPESIEFAHLRDGAYTAAIAGGANPTTAQILAGHRTGIKDAYIRRNPRMVADACKAIEAFYFPPERKAGKSNSKGAQK